MERAVSKRLRLAGLIALVIIIVYIVYITRSIFLPFFLGAVITYLLNPVVLTFQDRGTPRGAAVLLIYALFIVLFLLTLAVFLPNITRELTQIAESLPEQGLRFQQLISAFYEKYDRYNIPAPIRGVVEDAVRRFQGQLLRLVQAMVQSLLDFLSNIFSFVLAPIIAFYMTRDLEKIKKNFSEWLPAAYRNEILHVLSDVDTVLGGYIRGQLIVCVLVAACTSVGLTLFGIQYSLILGIIAGVTNIIPYFGPVIGWTPAVSIALMHSPAKAVYVTLVFAIIQQLESGILSPRILGQHVGLHPLVVILAILMAQQLFGTVGLIVGVPLAAVLKVIADRVWRLILS